MSTSESPMRRVPSAEAAAGNSSPAALEDPASDTDAGGLHEQILPWWGMYATSVASEAPSAGLALSIAGVALSAGNGSWLTYVIITVGILGVGCCVSWMARRFTTSGGLYSMSAAVGGSAGGYLQGLPQLLSLAIALPALVFGSGIYLEAFVMKAGLPGGKALYLVCYLAVLAIALVFALRDVRVSSRILLLLECGSVTLIVALLIISVARHHGGLVDHAQLGLHGVTVHGMFLSVAFATYVMAGFENSATLGREARNPNRDIPRAVTGTILIVGVLYIAASYVEVLALPGGKLAASAAPLNDIASLAGVGWFSWIVDLCVSVSFLSCVLAVTNTGARVLYTLGRDRVLPKAFSRVTARHGEPWFAVLLLTAGTLAAVLIFGLLPTAPLNAYAYMGTLSGYFFIAVYLMVIAMTLLRAFRIRALSGFLVAAGMVGAATLILAMYFSFVPLPQGAYGTVFWIFAALVGAGLAVAGVGGALRPQWWRNIAAQGGSGGNEQ